MREVTLELENFECPSNNEIRKMNSWVYKKKIENLKTIILVQIGEGPWPKVTFGKDYSAEVRKQVKEKLLESWAKKRKVFADITIRRPRRFDRDNSQGGCKILWDSLTRMGWMVDDHIKWFNYVDQPQVIGDPKVVVTLHIPENDWDDKRIRSLCNGGK